METSYASDEDVSIPRGWIIVNLTASSKSRIVSLTASPRSRYGLIGPWLAGAWPMMWYMRHLQAQEQARLLQRQEILKRRAQAQAGWKSNPQPLYTKSSLRSRNTRSLKRK